MKSFVSIYRVRCTKSFLSQLPANIFIFNLNLMVSDNRESSLISSIKSTLNNISHSFIINSLRRQGKNQRGVLGWGWGVGRGGWGWGVGGGVHVHHVHHVHMFISLRRQGNNQRGVLGWGAGVVWGGGGLGWWGVDPPGGSKSVNVGFF